MRSNGDDGYNVLMFSLVSFVLILSNGVSVFAHGEDKLGPHGGYIKMPGGFHTELVQSGSHELNVYLLDVEWKHPSVKDSTVKISQESEKLRCRPIKDHFLCDLSKAKIDLNKPGLLKITAVREKQAGAALDYRLPLRKNLSSK